MKNIVLGILCSAILSGCVELTGGSDARQRRQQEVLLQQATSQVGMPNIVNFREKKILKDILELRDQGNILTYTYIVAENTGQLIFICNSIGYGIPASTQFTNPMKIEQSAHSYGYAILPQSDPNGLFSPISAEGTYVLCSNPDKESKKATLPLYVEPRIIVSPFKLSNQ